MSKDEIKSGGQASGLTGHFDLDEMGLSDDELDVLRSKRKTREAKGDGWNEWGDDPWGKGGAEGDGPRSWAKDHNWTGEEEPEEREAPESGTAAIDLDVLRARNKKDNAMSLDEGGADEWDEGWDASGWSSGGGGGGGGGGGETDGTAALDISNFQLGSREKGVKDAKRSRLQAADLYNKDDDSNYRAGRFTGSEPSSRDNFHDDDDVNSFRDSHPKESYDDSGWSSGGLVDKTAAPKPAALAQLAGGEATAAIDLSVLMGSSSAPAEAAPDPHTPPAAPACLVIFAPEAPQPVQFELRRGVTTIGRELNNNIVLSDVFSSRKHALVLKRGDHFEVQDANSDNGTTVNGHPVSHARLRFGDHIEIGSTFLRFTPGQPRPEDLIASSPPPKPPHHLTPPPEHRKKKGMSTATILILFSLFMVLVVSGFVVLLLTYV